jgi:arginine decarboxylase
LVKRNTPRPDLDTPEIHGYKPEFGFRVYTEKAIEMCGPVQVTKTNGHHPEPEHVEAWH